MPSFHVARRPRGRWYFVADAAGLAWTRDLRTARAARDALRVLADLAATP